MKRFIITVIMLACTTIAFADIKKEGNTFKKESVKVESVKTKYFYETAGKKYDIYLSKNGKAYIIRTSKNGKEYKQYLNEISQELAKEYGITPK